MVPSCPGKHHNGTDCELVYYSNHSIATGQLDIASVKKDDNTFSLENLNMEISIYKKEFVEALSLHLRIVLYKKYVFKNEEVTEISLRVLAGPMLRVDYTLKMQRTDVSIATVNPIAQETELVFGPYRGITKPEWSTIRGIFF